MTSRRRDGDGEQEPLQAEQRGRVGCAKGDPRVGGAGEDRQHRADREDQIGGLWHTDESISVRAVLRQVAHCSIDEAEAIRLKKVQAPIVPLSDEGTRQTEHEKGVNTSA